MELNHTTKNGNENNMEEDYEEQHKEDPYKEQIIIDDINIVTEMNMSKVAMQQEEEQIMTNQFHWL